MNSKNSIHIIILSYRELNYPNYPSLKGSFTIKIPDWDNVIIHNMRYFVKQNSSWVSFPINRIHQLIETEPVYVCDIEFDEKKSLYEFLEKVRIALKLYIQENELNKIETKWN